MSSAYIRRTVWSAAHSGAKQVENRWATEIALPPGPASTARMLRESLTQYATESGGTFRRLLIVPKRRVADKQESYSAKELAVSPPNQDRRQYSLSSAPRLAVNVAFLREVKSEDGGFLFELLQAAHDALDALTLRRLNDRALVELLQSLKRRLAERFSLEESLGYFSDAIDFPADLSQEATHCRQEHESLYLAVCEIVDVAERLLYQESRCLRERAIQRITISFGCFYRRFKHHERCENHLADRVAGLRTEGQN